MAGRAMGKRKSIDVPPHLQHSPENAERLKDRASDIWGENVRAESRERRVAMMLAVSHEESFAYSGNPMDAVEALLSAGECGLAPPPGVMQWLFEAFAQYDAGDQSMDRLLGLTARRGSQSPRDRRNFEDEIGPLFREMWDLINVAKIETSHAAHMVAARFDADEPSRPDEPKAYGKYTAETLRQYWYRLDIAKQVRSAELIDCTDEAAENVLSRYPGHHRIV